MRASAATTGLVTGFRPANASAASHNRLLNGISAEGLTPVALTEPTTPTESAPPTAAIAAARQNTSTRVTVVLEPCVRSATGESASALRRRPRRVRRTTITMAMAAAATPAQR